MRKKSSLLLIFLVLLVVTIYVIIMRKNYFISLPDVAIKRVTVSKREVFVGDIVNISVTAKNEGGTDETFNITFYYNSTPVEVQTVSNLPAGNEKTLTFIWNTTSITPSNYVIKVKADVVSGEKDITDNLYDGGAVRVNRRTLLYIDPLENTVMIGQGFTVNVTVSDVANMYGFEFEIKYDPAILKILNVTEGYFLKRGGETFFWPEKNETEGYVYVLSTLFRVAKGVDGNGTLVTITFEAIGKGTTKISFYVTKLIDSQPKPIPHITNDGLVRV
jgi:hypothetical protein